MKSKLKEIFELADEEVSLLLRILKRAIATFQSTYVSTDLILNGFTSHKGIIVPIEEVEHKFLFDYYEKTFLETITEFLEKMWEEKGSQTNIFAFRVLLEMSVEDSFLIFNNGVNKDDKELLLLLNLLSDYASFNTPLRQRFYSWFEKLFVEYENLLKNNLSPKDYKEIEKLRHALLSGKLTPVMIKNIRRIISPTKGKILDKARTAKLFQTTDNYVGLSSGWSHALHGNVLLIKNSLADKSKLNHELRVYAHIFIAGISVLDQVVPYHANRELTDLFRDFKLQHSEFSVLFKKAWENNS